MVSPHLFKKKYYCKIDGKNYGPMNFEELKNLAMNKQLKSSDKVSLTFPSKDWLEASSLAELADVFKAQADECDVFLIAGPRNNMHINKRYLINCKTCGAKISKNAAKCPQCGEDTESTGTKIIMLGFVGLITLGAMIIIGARFLGEQETVFRQELIRENKNAIERENEDSMRRLMNELSEKDRLELMRKR